MKIPTQRGPQPIQTWYKDIKFRSRLEARWAVFFDELSIPYAYEPDRYQVTTPSSTRTYLPDFWLPKSNIWVEVKGKATQYDIETIYAASLPAASGGLPGPDEGPRLLMLGNIPWTNPTWLVWQHLISAMPNGQFVQGFSFVPGGIGRIGDEAHTTGSGIPINRIDISDSSIWHFDAFVDNGDHSPFWATAGLAIGDQVHRAYRAGRSARFEQGESGSILELPSALSAPPPPYSYNSSPPWGYKHTPDILTPWPVEPKREVAPAPNPVSDWVRKKCIADETGTCEIELYRYFVEWFKGSQRPEVMPNFMVWSRMLKECGYPAICSLEGGTRLLKRISKYPMPRQRNGT